MVAVSLTTLGQIRTLLGGRYPTDRWATLPDSTPAIACFIDGQIPIGPASSASYDRALVAIVGSESELVEAGFSTEMPTALP